jgi:hypothetical protein
MLLFCEIPRYNKSINGLTLFQATGVLQATLFCSLIPRGGSDPTVLPWLGSNDHDHVAISRIMSSSSPTLDHSKSRVSEMLPDCHVSGADGRFRILQDFWDVVKSTPLPLPRLRSTVSKAPTSSWIDGPGQGWGPL